MPYRPLTRWGIQYATSTRPALMARSDQHQHVDVSNLRKLDSNPIFLHTVKYSTFHCNQTRIRNPLSSPHLTAQRPSNTMVSILQANLISGFLECILFGIFFVMSIASLAMLLKRHRKIHSVPEIVTTSSFALRWKEWIAAWWSLRHSPLIPATALFMATVSAVRRPSPSSKALTLMPSPSALRNLSPSPHPRDRQLHHSGRGGDIRW